MEVAEVKMLRFSSGDSGMTEKVRLLRRGLSGRGARGGAAATHMNEVKEHEVRKGCRGGLSHCGNS